MCYVNAIRRLILCKRVEYKLNAAAGVPSYSLYRVCECCGNYLYMNDCSKEKKKRCKLILFDIK